MGKSNEPELSLISLENQFQSRYNKLKGIYSNIRISIQSFGKSYVCIDAIILKYEANTL